jgi:hypothetical protein
MNCSQCYYRISNKDIFCPSCSKKISSYAIYPSKRDLTLFEQGEYNFTIENNGMTPLSIDGCSHEKFELVGANIVASGSKEKITLKYDDVSIGDSGHFNLRISPSNDSEEKPFEFKVVAQPDLSFKVVNATEKDGVFNIPESSLEELKLWVSSSSRIAINKQPVIINESDHRLTNVEAGLPQTDFQFEVTGTENLRKGNSVELDIEFYFNGLTARKNFFIKVVSVASLKFNNADTKHNATIDGQFSPSRLDLIEGSEHLSEATLSYTVKGESIRIKDVIIPPLIILKDTDQKIILPQTIGTIIGSIIGNVYTEGEYITLNIELNAAIIPENITRRLIGVLSDFTVHITTVDTSNGFESIEIATLSVNILPRKDIAITIDYGTSNSCIAFLPYDSDEQNPQIAGLHLHGAVVSQIPSMIKFDDFYDKDGNKKPFLSEDIIIGPAVADYINNAEADVTTLNSIAWGFKSLLAKPETALYFTDSKSRTNKYTPLQLVSLYINKLVSHFENTYPYIVSELHITYPAAFSTLEKASLESAIYELPQFDETNVFLDVTEPVALAVSYANEVAHTLEDDEHMQIAIFDCGGGTTDLTLATLKSEEDEYGTFSKNLSFQASDGVYSKDKVTTVGGNYFTYLLANGYKNKAEKDYECQISFPNKFQLPIEVVDDKNIKFNASKFMVKGESRKVAKEYIPDTFPLSYMVDNEEIPLNDFTPLSEEVEQSILEKPITLALSKIIIMAYLLNEQQNIETITSKSIIGESVEIQNLSSQTLVVFANGMFAKVYTFIPNEPESIKLIGTKYRPNAFEDVIGYLNNLLEKNKISSFFIQHLLLVGFDESNELEKASIAEQQSQALITYFNANIDALILGGNSSNYPGIELMAKKLFKGVDIVNNKFRKIGVAQGACLMNQLSDDASSFVIQKNELLPYAIGYLSRGNFMPLLEQWKEVPDKNLHESRPKKVSARIADRTIAIYENRDFCEPRPKLIPHDSKMQPLIGKINIPEEYVGSYITFSLSLNTKKRLCYSLYNSESEQGIFMPTSIEPIPLHGEH